MILEHLAEVISHTVRLSQLQYFQIVAHQIIVLVFAQMIGWLCVIFVKSRAHAGKVLRKLLFVAHTP